MKKKGGTGIGLFGKKAKVSKPRALAFVDYEHWYISLDKMYHTRPDIGKWINDMEKTLDIRGIWFFGDFSKNPRIYEQYHRNGQRHEQGDKRFYRLHYA